MYVHVSLYDGVELKGKNGRGEGKRSSGMANGVVVR